MRNRARAFLLCALLVAGSLGSAALAAGQPKEAWVVGTDDRYMAMVVRGENGDQWTVYWTVSRIRGDLAASDLAFGDRIRFDYVERGGRLMLTELRHAE